MAEQVPESLQNPRLRTGSPQGLQERLEAGAQAHLSHYAVSREVKASNAEIAAELVCACM